MRVILVVANAPWLTAGSVHDRSCSRPRRRLMPRLGCETRRGARVPHIVPPAGPIDERERDVLSLIPGTTMHRPGTVYWPGRFDPLEPGERLAQGSPFLGDRPVENDVHAALMLTAPNSRPLPLAPAMALTPPVNWKVVSIRRPLHYAVSWCEWVKIVPLSKMNAPRSSTMLQVPLNDDGRFPTPACLQAGPRQAA